jgi:hypothetical protein
MSKCPLLTGHTRVSQQEDGVSKKKNTKYTLRKRQIYSSCREQISYKNNINKW